MQKAIYSFFVCLNVLIFERYKDFFIFYTTFLKKESRLFEITLGLLQGTIQKLGLVIQVSGFEYDLDLQQE